MARVAFRALALALVAAGRADLAPHAEGLLQMLTRDNPFTSERARRELRWSPCHPTSRGSHRGVPLVEGQPSRRRPRPHHERGGVMDPGTILAGALAVCVVGGFLPWVNTEAAVVGAALLLPRGVLPLLVLGAAGIQVLAKGTLYCLARWAPRGLPRRARERARAALRPRHPTPVPGAHRPVQLDGRCPAALPGDPRVRNGGRASRHVPGRRVSRDRRPLRRHLRGDGPPEGRRVRSPCSCLAPISRGRRKP